MNRKISATVVAWILFSCVTALPAEMSLRVKGESLTPGGESILLNWQVEKRPDSYVFYLNHVEKAEMVISDGKVVTIRRRVRFAGKDKWIVLKDPHQIALELKSGFYPFSAILNYQKGQIRETVMRTGRFTVEESAVK
jgi:hypothetical protein